MAEQHKDQEFVEYLVKGIVNHPDDVKVERTVDEMGVLLTLHVNPEDMGYVIGRQGQTARSIRTLLKIVGAKSNARVNLKIYEPEGSRKSMEARGERAPRAEAAPAEPDTSVLDDLKI
ncbi:MAG: KH domain-containing protein [Patescibacteria group bacterium]|nr:KH domain-containing protein [Patescibacteria group bacterium]